MPTLLTAIESSDEESRGRIMKRILSPLHRGLNFTAYGYSWQSTPSGLKCPNRADPPPVARSRTRGEALEMLAALGFGLLTILLACSAMYLISWAHETYQAAIEASSSRPTALQVARDLMARDRRSDCESVYDLLWVETRGAA
jgi:hypothetical protein